MARGKIHKAPLATSATSATRRAQGARKPEPSREKYEIAVWLARAAIRAAKKRPAKSAMHADPEKVMGGLIKKIGAGVTLTADEAGALCAAMADLDARKKRGRGRPKGRNLAAVEAFRAAAVAVHLVLLDTYSNDGTGHRMTRCDALAAAMQAEGFFTFTTREAAIKEMKAFRRDFRDMLRNLSSSFSRLQVALQDAGQAWRKTVQDMQESLVRIRSDTQAMGRAWGALGEQIRALNLTPEKLKEIEKNINSER